VLLAESGPAALDLRALNAVQVIISDQRMAPMSGTEFLSIASRLYPRTQRIILSGYTDLAVVTEAVNRGAVFRFLTKPWDDVELRTQVREALQRFREGTAG
jgi:diguanylate cyclase